MTVLPCTWLDVAILAVVALAAALGAMKGFLRGLFSLLAIPAALAVAFRGYRPLGGWLRSFLRDDTLCLVLGFAVLAIATTVVFILIGVSVRNVAVRLRLGCFDGFLGLLLGLTKGILISGLVIWLGLALLPGASKLVDRSAWGHSAVGAARAVVRVIGAQLPRLLQPDAKRQPQGQEV